ncbi:MAG: acyl-ACP--UDP-N-acetylglucosamine O-acyltransferase [Rhizobiaceae bacterium]|nr:acyl-ACP--UDP-N-acetylglucosamine O-acyltransferase [Rhizobiaceae bacterium]
MANNIHPSAVVEDGAIIGEGSTIGPFCHIGPNAVIGEGADFKSHVAVYGHTTIGARARIFPFASIGHEPQDLKHKGEKTTLTIGDDCLIREGVTMNPGTAADNSNTTVGNNCTFLANSHVAHDCQLGNNIIFSNGVLIGGHCKIGNNVIIGGGAAVHQFCRIGDNAFIGGLAGLENDLIPFGIALGNRAYLGGLNLIGMKRAGIERDSIHTTRAAFKNIFSGEEAVQDAVKSLPADQQADAVVSKIVEFIKASADRSLCTPK